jgi:bifunctional DNA-binding transcriptional regulator/antitoxin component of YhaV-PrlF toxin-antitoxin module
MIVDIKQKSQVTIPMALLKKLKLKIGDKLDIIEKNGKLIITPVVVIPRDQEWYWSKEWQEKERKADEELKADKINSADTVDELIDQLEND